MPQLKPEIAERIDGTEYSGGLLEPGVYEVVLVEVEARPGNIAPTWSWKFHVAPGQKGAGRTMYVNTSLSEDASWKMTETFHAFEVPATTNTDLMIGKRCKALVYKGTAQQGKRQGQFVNGIQELMPLGRRTVDPTGNGAAEARAAAPVDPEDPTAPSGGVKVGTAPGADDEPPF